MTAVLLPTLALSDVAGDDAILTGEPKVWHKLTLDISGPEASERDDHPNPFTDYDVTVVWRHESGRSFRTLGYFAADGDAANSSATQGRVWRSHFVPDSTGRWQYETSFLQGRLTAVDDNAKTEPVPAVHGLTGDVLVTESDKVEPDLRAEGRLQYVGQRYLRFAGSGRYFLKAGADAPETLLAYQDFDGTFAGKPNLAPLKTWQPHVRDWRTGDPVWQDHKGKGLIGAVNYLADKGCNAFSFLTYNAGGDGDNVWPFVQREDKLHYDCSKLDQWGIVFDHATRRGMYLHFKMQETENDDQRNGNNLSVPEALDGGALGIERKLYCRELVARFGHNLALNWNLGEENTQSFEEQQAMLAYLKQLDPYGHHRVIHTYPDQQNKVYEPHLGSPLLTGLSLQNSHISQTHRQTVHWVQVSSKTKQPWVVAFDESGSAAHGQCPDLGYQDFDGHDKQGNKIYTQHQVRQQTLWGTLMGGGAGVEYYFGYQFVQNDLNCQDWRSRDQSWDYCRIATRFFYDNRIRFWEMQSRDELVGNSQHENAAYCLAKANESYVVYLANNRDSTTLDLTAANGEFEVNWFDPENGGNLTSGTVLRVSGGDVVKLGQHRSDRVGDWIILIRRHSEP
ncbi:MAG: DUF5060 domain-containing protein [Planctomycetales bacterium]|nr:DUF5060 domain-containing protein [Planctomycetales bacterium]